MPSTSGVGTTSFATLGTTPTSDVATVSITTESTGATASLVPVVTVLPGVEREILASLVPVVNAGESVPIISGPVPSNVSTISITTLSAFDIVGQYQPGQSAVLVIQGADDQAAYAIYWSTVNDHTHASAVQLTVTADDIDGSGDGTITVTAAKGQVRYGDQGYVIFVQGATVFSVLTEQIAGPNVLVWEVSELPPDNASSWFQLQAGSWSIGDQIEVSGFATDPADSFTVADLLATTEPRIRTSTALQTWLDSGELRRATFDAAAHNGNGWGDAGAQSVYSGDALASTSIVPVVTVVRDLARTTPASLVPRITVTLQRNVTAQITASLIPSVNTLISTQGTSITDKPDTASLVPVVTATALRGVAASQTASVVPVVTVSENRLRLFAFRASQASVQPRVDTFAVRSVATTGPAQNVGVAASIVPSVIISESVFKEVPTIARIRFRLLRKMIRFLRR
jgi:hypothetical protein